MSSSWLWFILGIACLVLAFISGCIAEEFADRNKNAFKVVFFTAAALLVVLAVASFCMTLHARNNHRAASLTSEIRNKGFTDVNINDVYGPSTATVTIPNYPGGCRIAIYKEGNWLLDVGNVTRSITTPKDMTNWSSVKFACNKNAQ